MKKVSLQSKNGKIKVAPVGFSWTIILFGVFVPLLRQDYAMALGFFCLNTTATYFGGIPLMIIGSVIEAIFYNKYYISELLKKGFNPVSNVDEKIIESL